LYPILNGNSPDDSFSNVPYEKGFQFLDYLQTLTSGPFFNDFLKHYIGLNSLTSIDYNVFRSNWIDYVNADITLTSD
jgi:leukotriene-A4 hydrolase